jgi:hypothetical protein
MKQHTNIFIAVAICTTAFCSCSKHTGKQITGSTPTVKKGLSLNQGQKLHVDNTVKTVSTMEMMGQQMEVNAEIAVAKQLVVKEKKESSYVLSATTTKMTTTGSFMGQSMSYDSDKKEDNDSEIGKVMKDQLNVAKEAELSDQGQVLHAQKDTAQAASLGGGNPLMAMMGSMGGQDESNGTLDAFQVVPAGAKPGDTWADSTIATDAKIHRTYTLKELNGNDATVTVAGTQSLNKTIENQGMEVNITLDSKITGDILVDISTGIIKQKTITVEGAGNVDAMGQAIPMTTKATSTSIVKSL